MPLASMPMPWVPDEHHPELLEAALSTDLLVLVDIDTKDVQVMLSETTDPRLAAHILRDIADGLDTNTDTLRQQPSETFPDGSGTGSAAAPPG
jgi:hypothetical protein